MGRNDRRRHNRNWNNQNNHQSNHSNQDNQKITNAKPKFVYEPDKEAQSKENQLKENAIREFKSHQVTCAKCGQVINELASAMSDAQGNPVHFDCVLEQIKGQEKLLPGQQVTYIGNGRFGVVTFENPRDLKKFKIEKIIEYEDKTKPVEWRSEMANLYSQVK
ncbi:MAG: hypothetical protein MJ169_02735 [Treponema sp.]|nr:hypothetical protein [Treponema sp.]